MDGFFSGAICYDAAERLLFKGEEKEITVKEWTYNYELPSVDAIKKKYDAVIVADLMPDVDFMMALYDESNPEFLTWFDHHISPDEALYAAGGEKIQGLRTKEKKAGCMLAWEYYHPEECPNFIIETVSTYDSWNREGVGEEVWNNEIMPAFTYLDCKIKDWKGALAEMEYWEGLFRNYKDYKYKEEAISQGELIRNAKRARYYRERSDGYPAYIRYITCPGNESDPSEINNGSVSYKQCNAFVVNTQTRGSEQFEDMENRDDFDVFIVFNTTGKKWKYSMYTFKDDICCNTMLLVGLGPDSKDCLRFRGHKGASGAVSSILLAPTAM